MEKLILSIDCGTQSIRAMLFDGKGELHGKVKETFEPYFSTEEGFAEQYVSVYWDALCKATRKLKAQNRQLWGSVCGVSVAAMRDVGICLDSNMKPLRPAISWLDRRQAECKDRLPLKTRLLFAVSGMGETVMKTRKECRSNWIKENEPAVWEKTAKYVQLSAYLNYLLTGELKDGIASTIGHIPVDYKNRKWMDQKHFQMCLFKFPDDLLYPLVEAGEVLGKITAEAAELTGITEGTILYAAGSDKGAETLGTGVIALGKASLSFGTTATIQIATEKYVEPITFLPAYPALMKGVYNPEIMVNRGYWMLTWFCNEFMKNGADDKTCFEKELDKAMTAVPPCSEGLYVEPYWSPSLKRTEARGAMVGFTERHTKYHIYRAIIEGINYSLMEGARSFEKKTGVPIKELTVSGGGAQSDIVCQLTANMFGIPVSRAQTYETSGLGAAICGFIGAGVYGNYEDAIFNMVHVSKTFTPDMNEHDLYEEFFNKVYTKSYKRLKPLFTAIKSVKY